MNHKFRSLLIAALVLALSVMVWSIAAAQDATTTEEPTAESTAEPTMPAMQESTPSPRAFLGVALQDSYTGVQVAQVVPGSAADDAGLKVGDIITAINGDAVANSQDTAAKVGALRPGEQVNIDFTRGGDKMSVTATLGSQADAPEATQEVIPAVPIPPVGNPNGRGNQPGNGNGNQPGNGNDNGNVPNNFFQMMPPYMFGYGNGRLGVTYVTLDEQTAQQYGVTATEGALIVSVDANSPASDAGLQENDIVTAVNHEPVDQERTLRDRLIAYEPGDVVTLTIIRDGASQDIDVTMGQPQVTSEAMPGFSFQFPNVPNMPEVPTPAATPNM